MSLETELARNTEAVIALTRVLMRLDGKAGLVELVDADSEDSVYYALKETASAPEADAPAAKSGSAPVDAPRAVAQEEAATPAEPVEAAEKPADEETSEPEPVTMASLALIVTQAAARNRGGLVALLEKYGVKRAGELAESDRAAFAAQAEKL